MENIKVTRGEDVDKLMKRYERACSAKDDMSSLYDLAYRMSSPDRDTFNSKSIGSRNGINLFDSTGVIATQRFVNHMQAALTPPFKKWVALEAGNAFESDPDLADEINRSLETATDTAFRIIEASNFNIAIAEFYQDLAVGTGVMLVREGDSEDEPIYFITVPLEQIAIEENPYNGKIRSVFRTHNLAGSLIKETWSDAKLPGYLEQELKDNPNQECCLIECTYVEKGNIFYDVILKSTKKKIVERKMKYNPWIVTRWSKRPGEVLGRGVVIQALNDLCMLNMAKELSLMSAQLNTFGVWTVADSDIINPSTLSLSPGTFIPVSSNGSNPSIAPLPRSGDFNAQQFMFSELQDSIRQIMLNDRMPLESGAVRSATEVAARIQSNRIDTESAFGRLMYEFVQPLWQNIIYILSESGKIYLPPELQKINNYSLKINVLAPIAREQSIEDVQSLVNTAQIVQGIGGNEALALGIKIEDVASWIGEMLGVSPKLLRTKEEQEQKVQEAQQAQMQMAMMQQAEQAMQQQPSNVGVM